MKLKEIENLISSQDFMTKRKKIYDISNFKDSRLLGEDYFCFNSRIMSIELIDFFKNNEILEDVFFHPSAPPPGRGADSISYRYTIHAKLKKEKNE